MLDSPKSEPAFAAPFVSSVMRVEPAWIDYNGHLNMAYYNVLFDRAVDEVYELLGLGLDYLETSRHSTFTAEIHVRYLRELRAGDPVRVTFQLLGFDEKRLHYFEELHHAEENWLGEHGAACRYGRAQDGGVSVRGRRASRTHEGGTRKPADPGGRRTAHRHAGKAIGQQ